jgi:hypothetical protein
MSTIMPGFYAGPPIDFNEMAKIWANTWEKMWTANSNAGDWRMWLPRAVWLNWSDPKTWQTQVFNPTTWLPLAYSTPEERDRAITMLNIYGDYIGGDKSKGDLIKDLNNSDVISKATVKKSNIPVRDQS